MALAIDHVAMMEFSGHSGTTTDEFGGGCCDWSDWSPMVDWDAVPGSRGRDGFHDLMESMLEDGTGPHQHHLPPQWCDSPPSVHTVINDMEGDETDGHDFKGLRLVHLLMAAAEALSSKGESSELARVILVRLKELVSPATGGDGTNMERLAAHFTDALHGLLEHVGAAPSGGGGKHSIRGLPHREEGCYNQTDMLAAFQLLQDMSPYVKFGHFTANQAILEAVGHARRVHVVDYDIMEGVQWPSLMQALVSQKGGQSAPHLRITALSRASSGRRTATTVQETGRRLAAFAASLGQPFSFNQCRLDPGETFRPAALKLVRGEALVINCMLHLPHSTYHAPSSVASFLSGARALSPRLVTLAEEEAGPGGRRRRRVRGPVHGLAAPLLGRVRLARGRVPDAGTGSGAGGEGVLAPKNSWVAGRRVLGQAGRGGGVGVGVGVGVGIGVGEGLLLGGSGWVRRGIGRAE
ncbi:hypothetical protein NL676_027720 [Syzygium grande]|nr:hypothetical protein NL676_027720 [Syzygium grande]